MHIPIYRFYVFYMNIGTAVAYRYPSLDLGAGYPNPKRLSFSIVVRLYQPQNIKGC